MANLEGLDFTVYETDHEISQQICRIISKGTGFPLTTIEKFKSGPAIIYGKLRGCKAALEANLEAGHPTLVVDHGYFSSRDQHGHWRFTLNSFDDPGHLVDLPADRWEHFGREFKQYRDRGEYILILSPSSFWAYYGNFNQHVWDWHKTQELKAYTDLPVVVKDKRDETPLQEYLKDAKAVVHYASMGGLTALEQGVPVITLGPSFLKDYTNTQISDINNLKHPEREKLFCNLAYRQFTFSEILSGFAWQTITKIYKEAY